MCLVDVDGAGELRLLPDGLAEDHDLLEEEDGEGLHLGRAGLRGLREGVQAVQRTAVKELALRSYLALEEKVGDFRNCILA